MGKMHHHQCMYFRWHWRLIASAALASPVLLSCTAFADKTPLHAISKSVSPEQSEFASSDPDVTSFLKFTADGLLEHSPNAGTVELDADRVIVIRYPVGTADAELIEPRIKKVYPDDPTYSDYLQRYHLENIGDTFVMKLD